MNNLEKTLCEAVSNYLNGDIGYNADNKSESNELSHTVQYGRESLNQKFAVEIADVIHYDSIKSAFSKVHAHKDVTSISFPAAFEKELRGRAVPESEIKIALDNLQKLSDELRDNVTEKDMGYNRDLDRILSTTNGNE